jgi:hypothetical protein
LADENQDFQAAGPACEEPKDRERF